MATQGASVGQRILQNIVSPTSAGILVGFNLAIRVAALAILVFAGPLVGGLYAGVFLFLCMSLLLTIGLILRPDVPPVTIATFQDAPIAILMPAILVLGASMSPDAATEIGFATALAVLGGTAVMAGVIMLLLSWFDLARLIRLLPFPVVAGYLASTGALLVLSSFEVAIRVPDGVDPQNGWTTVGLAFGLCVLISLFAKWRRDAGPLIALAIGYGVFFLWANYNGVSVQQLRAFGFLPAEIESTTRMALDPSLYRSIDWAIVLSVWPLLVAAASISALGSILNVNGVELVAKAEISLRKALVYTGWANIIFGMAGSAPGYVSASNTSVAHELGGNKRAVALVSCGFLGLAIWYAPLLLASIPIFVSAGVLIYIGWTILLSWFVQQRNVISTLDWVQIGGLVVVAVTFGMFEALAAGIVIASLTFAITYSRLPVLRRKTTLKNQRSTVDRGPAETALLDKRGDEVAVIELQGFLFFGSVERLVQAFRAFADAASKVSTIILDFKTVSGFDSASIEALRKLEFMASASRKKVVLTGLNQTEVGRIIKGGLLLQDGAMTYCVDMDAALEQAEIEILASLPDSAGAGGALEALAAAGASGDAIDRLKSKMTRRWLAKGERLIKSGDAAQDIYLIESGRLAVLASMADGSRTRVRSLRAGAFVGEIASYAGLKRTADVVAEEPSVVFAVSPRDIEALTQTDPELAAIWHKMIASTLADKIDRTNRLLRDRA